MKDDKFTLNINVSKENDSTLLDKLELYFNIINHIFIGFVSIYMTIFCYQRGYSSRSLHVWLCTIGVS